MTFLILLIFPLLVAVASFIFLKGITWKEFALHVGAQLIVAGAATGILLWKDTSDTEVWNGYVTNKAQVYVSCSHSYPCNCRPSCSGSGKNKSCTTVCDICYEHSNDWDWDIYTSNQEIITIDRIDSRGSWAPPRWQAIQFGEPTAKRHSYTNYIKAAPGTLFRHQGNKGKYVIPTYPQHIYDYYKLNRLVSQVPVDAVPWNEGLSKVNAELGGKKQANMIVVLTDQPDDWYYALEEAWVGGKKNDVILVIGMKDGKAAWTQVMAWTTAEIFKIKLRDAILALPAVTPEATLTALRDNVEQYYQRKHMKDFEYLQASVTPSSLGLGISIIIGLLVAIGLAYVFHRYDVFGDE